MIDALKLYIRKQGDEIPFLFSLFPVPSFLPPPRSPSVTPAQPSSCTNFLRRSKENILSDLSSNMSSSFTRPILPVRYLSGMAPVSAVAPARRFFETPSLMAHHVGVPVGGANFIIVSYILAVLVFRSPSTVGIGSIGLN